MTADPQRAQELDEERFGPQLTEDQVSLLAAVRDRRVHRYRRSSTTTISAGEDVLDRGPSLLPRRVNPRIEALRRRGLVVLQVPPEADRPGDGAAGRYPRWPWELTAAGRKALGRAAPKRAR